MEIPYKGYPISLDVLVKWAKSEHSYRDAYLFVEALRDYYDATGDVLVKAAIDGIRHHFGYNQQIPASPQNLPKEDNWNLLPHAERVKRALVKMEGDGFFSKKYYYTWPWLVINESEEIGLNFKTPRSFVEFLNTLSLKTLPSADSLKKANQNVCNRFPNWAFTDCDTSEATKRINCGRRFLKIFRTGE